MLFAGLHAAVAIIGAVAVMRGRQQQLRFVGFLAPLTGLSATIGGVEFGWPLVGFGLLAILSLHRRDTLPGVFKLALIAIAYWSIAITTYFAVFDEEASTLVDAARLAGWGEGQTTYRYLVQWLAFAVMIGGFYLASRAVTSPVEARSIAEGFITGVMTSVTYGFAMAVLQGYGSDALAFNTLTTMAGRPPASFPIFEFGPLRVARFYGLSGEPKHLAGMCVLALAAAYALAAGDRLTKRHAIQLLVLAVGILFTFSTSGYVAGALVLVAGGLHAALTGRLNRRIFVLAALLGLAAGPLLISNSATQQAIIQERILARLGSPEAIAHFEYKDAALADYLATEPSAAIVGRGTGGSDFFILSHSPITIRAATTITPTYAFSRTVGDLGLVGLALMLWLVALAQGFCRRWPTARLFALISLVAFVQPALGLPAYFLLLGAFTGGAAGQNLPGDATRCSPTPPHRVAAASPSL
ncbi:hypothetical protein BH23ACT6_BH23ACT6_26740 [soil metagenome]